MGGALESLVRKAPGEIAEFPRGSYFKPVID